MFEAEVVKEGHTEQTLFECPTCSRTHLYSRRLNAPECGEYRNRKQEGYRLKTAGIPG
jgi:hypothetical protein